MRCDRSDACRSVEMIITVFSVCRYPTKWTRIDAAVCGHEDTGISWGDRPRINRKRTWDLCDHRDGIILCGVAIMWTAYSCAVQPECVNETWRFNRKPKITIRKKKKKEKRTTAFGVEALLTRTAHELPAQRRRVAHRVGRNNVPDFIFFNFRSKNIRRFPTATLRDPN